MTSKEKRKNPLRIAYYFIHHPCKILLLITIILILTVVGDYFGFKFVSTSTHSYFVLSDAQVHRKDSLDLAKEVLGSSSSDVLPKTQMINKYTFIIMYKTRDETNILQPTNIADYIEFMIETNNKIPNTDYDEYYSFCLADPTDPYTNYPDCSKSAVWDPIVAYFQNNPNNITQQDIDQFIESNLNNPYTSGAFLSCFQEDFEDTLHSQYYRAFYRFGLPYPDIDKTTSSYKDASDHKEEQDEMYGDWAFPIFQNIQIEENNHENIEVVILGGLVRDLQRQSLTYGGITFAGGSIMTVFLIMCWHLNSLFLAFASMLQIMLGFPFAYAVYRYIFGVTFFDTLNTLVIFLILGIGADDVFVFVDAWVQSGHFVAKRNENEKNWLIERMDFAFRRAAKAMIVTTATTFFAFMATSFSPIMPIAAFGLWAGCVVVINYVMVISFFPALLSWWYQNVRPKERCPSCCYCCCCKHKKLDQTKDGDNNNNNNNNKQIEMQDVTKKDTDRDTRKDNDSNGDGGDAMSASQIFTETATGEEPRCLELFLGETWSNWNIRFSRFTLPVVLIMVGIAAWKASSISPLTKQEQWFDEDHYMEKMFAWQQHFDGGSVTSLINIQIVWGLNEKVDRSGTSYWDVEYYGKPQFDDTFNPSTSDAQQYLHNVCDILLTNYSSNLYDVADYFDCWIYDFRKYGESLGLQFPFILSNHASKQQEIFTDLVTNWTTTTQIGIKYASNGQVGVIDDQLKFVYIEYKIPVSRFLTDKSEIYSFWEDIMIDLNDIAPDGINNGYQTSSFAWAWMATQRSFVISAVQGVAIAIPLALLCLILSTQNWIISIFATSAILSIIACEVALMVLQEWELGISESIAVVMIVGFSVDYVVHLGNAYIECEMSEKRDERLKSSLFTMGISVVSGAMTTFGSGFWLIFPEFLFFKKFGILVMSVVTFSLFFSMIYFISLLAVCGPQKKAGNIPILKYIGILLSPFSKCWCKCCIYCCCCCGTIDNYYDDEPMRTTLNDTQKNNENTSNKKISDLIVKPSVIDEVFSGSEMISGSEINDIDNNNDAVISKEDDDDETDDEVP